MIERRLLCSPLLPRDVVNAPRASFIKMHAAAKASIDSFSDDKPERKLHPAPVYSDTVRTQFESQLHRELDVQAHSFLRHQREAAKLAMQNHRLTRKFVGRLVGDMKKPDIAYAHLVRHLANPSFYQLPNPVQRLVMYKLDQLGPDQSLHREHITQRYTISQNKSVIEAD